MIRNYITTGVCTLALSAALATAQETTIDVTSWGYLPNYGAAEASGTDTNSPTFSNSGGDFAFGAKFAPMDISEDESLVVVEFTLTVDGGITGGLFRFGLFSDNGQLTGPTGNAFGGTHTGFTGYLWSPAAGGHAPGSAEGDAGTGTIMGLAGSQGGNWVSTQRPYSVVPEGLQGPAEGAPETGGTFDVMIELFRLSPSAIELAMNITQQDGEFTWNDAFRVDDFGAVPGELESVNLIAFADLNVGANTYEFSNVTVTGVPAEGGPPTGEEWLGYPVDASGYANTGGWLGNVWVTHAPWVWSDLGWIWVAEDSHSESGAWAYAIK